MHANKYNQAAPSYQAQWPPSTLKSDPVMKLLPSPSKKRTGARNSSAVLRRYSMLSPTHCASIPGFASDSVVASVRMYPGESVLTRMSGMLILEPHSAARDRPSWWTAALDALYPAVSTPCIKQRT